VFAVVQSAAINRLEEVNNTQYEMLEEMKTLLDVQQRDNSDVTYYKP
jgi:hypothetical protein